MYSNLSPPVTPMRALFSKKKGTVVLTTLHKKVQFKTILPCKNGKNEGKKVENQVPLYKEKCRQFSSTKINKYKEKNAEYTTLTKRTKEKCKKEWS